MSKAKKRKSSTAKANPPRSAAPPASKRSWLLWAGLAAVGLLAIVVVLAWQNSRGAAPDTASGGTPNLQVDQTSIDFGDVPVNQMEGPHDFKVVLASNDPDEPTKELRVLSNWVQ